MDEDINNLYLSFKTEKDPFKKAKILLKLKKDKNVPIKEIGKNVELSSSYLSHILRLNKLPELIIDGFYADLISITHLYIISRLHNTKDMVDVYEKVLSKNLTTIETDEIIRDYLYSIKTEGEYLSEQEKKSILEYLDSLDQINGKIIQSRIKSKLIIEIKGSLKETTEKLRRIFDILRSNKK